MERYELYTIVQRASVAELVLAVNTYLTARYVPVGGPVYAPGESGGTWSQAVVLRKEVA